tara:strand:- start:568 stop:702 length:135 start_codon:yes stop_codon:yes gene_type:complete
MGDRYDWIKKKGLRRDPLKFDIYYQKEEGAVAPTYSSTAAAGFK